MAKILIDPTEYRAFLKRYIKDFYEIDAPMIAGAVERCLLKLETQPFVDAVEVVRCKDCIYNENGSCSFSKYVDPSNYQPDWFCADGERKGDGNG